MFEKLRLDPDDIRAKRQLSLVERWSKGKRLNPEELREIADVIPGHHGSHDHESHAENPPMGPVFTLEPESARPEPRWEEWEKLYGSSARTLKRWASIGRGKGDECPLWEAGAMPGWWTRNMTQRIPHKVLLAAKSDEGEGGEPEQVVPATGGDGSSQLQEEGEISADDLGLERTLERLSLMEVRLSRKAAEPGQTKAWLDTVSRMSTVAEKLRVEAERFGRLLPRDQVEEAIHAFHGPIEREIRLLYKTMCDALGLPPSPEREARWNEEVDNVFRRFGEEVLR